MLGLRHFAQWLARSTQRAPVKSRRAPCRSIRFEPLEQRLALAVTAEQLSDLSHGELESFNLTPGSSIPNPSGSDFATIGDITFFPAYDDEHGYELWKSDGTAAGTVLVKDINLGAGHSGPRWLTAVGRTVFFEALDEAHGYELWKSDGTEAGTVLVKDIIPGRPDGQPWDLANVAGTLFFSAQQYGAIGGSGHELWKSDGTEEGTVLVKNIMPDDVSPFGSMPHNFAEFNGVAYFSADDGVHGQEVWKSDGTAEGTVLVKDVRSGPVGFYPFGFYDAGDSLIFSTQHFDPQTWKTDGTESGTVQLVNDRTFPGRIDTTSIIDVSGTLFFLSQSDLWRTNGNSDCSVMLKSGALGPLTEVNGVVYFGTFSSGRYELWKTDGTVAGTVRIKSFEAGVFEPSHLTNVAGTLFFTAYDAAAGEELWTSDGTTAGTVLVGDFFPGTSSSSPRDLRAVGNKLLFSADDGVHGREPWITSEVAAPSSPPQLPPVDVPCTAPPTGTDPSPPVVPDPVEPAPIPLRARDYVASIYQPHGYTGSHQLPVASFAEIDPERRFLVSVVEVGTPSHGGVVTIAPNTNFVNYTPAPGFLGTETFTFTLSDGAGNTSTATATLTVVDTTSAPAQVEFALQITDLDGVPLTALAPGEEFLLTITAQDLRDSAHGVFAAYLDITWDSKLAETAGPIRFGSSYPSGRSGSLGVPGLIDEGGAFSQISELGGFVYEVFSVPMRALAAGALNFATDPADVVPTHNVLLYGSGESPGSSSPPVSFEALQYGTASIVIGGLGALPDAFDVAGDEPSTPLDVLANDFANQSHDPRRSIVDVVQPSVGGTVEIAGGGKFLRYHAAEAFNGIVTFGYTSRSAVGELSSAMVTLNVVSAAAVNPAGIRLEDRVLLITGSSDNDRLTVTARRGNLQITGTLRGERVQQSIRIRDVQRIEAELGDGDDVVIVRGNVRQRLFVDGGGGNDSISAGGASAILLGGEGDDRLTGGARRDLLIGGEGVDSVLGNVWSDLVIEGSTVYDQSAAALAAILAEWNTPQSRAKRLANLRNGAGAHLSPQNISIDPAGDGAEAESVDQLFRRGLWAWFS